MATTNITQYQGSTPTTSPFLVASGTSASVQSGRFCLKALGQRYVSAFGTGSARPVVGTDFIAGIADTDSTETATSDGSVSVAIPQNAQKFLINADSSILGTISTQAGYNTLVGRRVLLNVAADGTQTVLGTDGATNGLIIEALDISTAPVGKVCISIREGVLYNA